MGCVSARLIIVLGIFIIGKIGHLDGLTTTKYPPGHSSYTTTAENVFLAATTEQPTYNSSMSSSSKFSMSAFQPSLSSSLAELLPTPPSPLSGDTSVPFSVTVDGTTAFCQLSFSTDFVCISYAEVSCQMTRADGAVPHMGQVEHTWDTITRIDGVAYDITASLTFNPTSQTIATLVICSSSTCTYSSSSSGVPDTCMDYPRLCGSSSSSSSSSSRSSSSPIHSTFKYISSSYASFYSSSSSRSSSSSSSSSIGEGLPFIFGSSPSESSSSSSACSTTDFAWSSGSGVIIAWPSIVSSSSFVSTSTISSSSSLIYTTPTTTTTTTTTTAFTTPGGVTNSKGSVIT